MKMQGSVRGGIYPVDQRPYVKTEKGPRRVVRSDGNVYSSPLAAARDIGCSSHEVRRAIRGGYHVRGFRFRWEDEDFVPLPKKAARTPVTCVESGAEYPSLTKAALAEGVSASTMTRASLDGTDVNGRHYRRKSDGR